MTIILSKQLNLKVHPTFVLLLMLKEITHKQQSLIYKHRSRNCKEITSIYEGTGDAGCGGGGPVAVEDVVRAQARARAPTENELG